ncbi:hypothetical protein PC121_g5440 [Phytophthora cactorum]|nr:hypothetical protein PC121_g5440 [Phytophthora cactorum]
MAKFLFFAALLLIAGAGLPTDAEATSEEPRLQPTDDSGSSNTTLKESVAWSPWYGHVPLHCPALVF